MDGRGAVAFSAIAGGLIAYAADGPLWSASVAALAVMMLTTSTRRLVRAARNKHRKDDGFTPADDS